MDFKLRSRAAKFSFQLERLLLEIQPACKSTGWRQPETHAWGAGAAAAAVRAGRFALAVTFLRFK